MRSKLIALLVLFTTVSLSTSCGNTGSESAYSTADTTDIGYYVSTDNTGDYETKSEDISEIDVSGDSGTSDAESYEQKLIRTVDMNVETTEFDSLIDVLEAKAEELGGYVESSSISTSSSSRWGSITFRIPAGSLAEFTKLIGENATVTYESEDTEDVTLSYVDLENHLTALRTEQETLTSMLETADSIDAIIAI